MTAYYINTLSDDAPFRFSGAVYEADDRTGFVKDDNNNQVKLNHLQDRAHLYWVTTVKLKEAFDRHKQIKSDGSASTYYDFPKGALTLNDLLEYKGDRQWLGDSFHLSNIFKAAWRWGEKEGVDVPYDCRKIIYSGCRLLMKHAGVEAVRKTLQGLLDDPQFQERT